MPACLNNRVFLPWNLALAPIAFSTLAITSSMRLVVICLKGLSVASMGLSWKSSGYDSKGCSFHKGLRTVFWLPLVSSMTHTACTMPFLPVLSSVHCPANS